MKRKMQNLVYRLYQSATSKAAMITVPLATAASYARADVDYTSIGAAVSVAGVATAIVGMGVLKVGPNVARWATNKLANFFR